jgi:primosomal protein N''
MDNQQLMAQVKAATETARNWHLKGWTMKFGPYQNEVNSLAAANEMNDRYQNRQEALTYWQQIEMASNETVAQGEKAMAALAQGNVDGAKRAVYYAMFVEKKFDESAPNWGPVFNVLK